MKVYFITQKSMGEIVTLEPRIPDSAWNEGAEKKEYVHLHQFLEHYLLLDQI